MHEVDDNLFEGALHCLLLNEPVLKVKCAKSLNRSWQQGNMELRPLPQIKSIVIPGRPEKPELVDPKQVPRRNFNSQQGRLALAHAIAHIEFNAINLALDAVYRFQQMPAQYYSDWCRVAAEEAEHFMMLAEYLEQNGIFYGQQNAHNGLWEMAVKTASDVMIRMALVPRVLEARGLDVTPTMIKKLYAVGDTRLMEILQKIFDEEIGHVKIGSYWFNTLCKKRNIEPQETFLGLIKQYMDGAKFGPFETDARVKAGFTEKEMNDLLSHF